MRRLMLGLLLAGSAAGAQAPKKPPLVVYAAGSTTGVLGAVLKRYTAETGEPVMLRTGPAGLMRERIEAGDAVDLYVSANMAHPQALHAAGKSGPVAVFAHNRICVTAKHEVRLTQANLLDRLLDPKVRIGTSTPGADPGGDYAQAFFERADRVYPGATAVLKAKARAVVGATITPAASKATNALEDLIKHGVDVSTGYCSSRSTTPDTSVDKVEVPASLAVPVDYGMTIVTTSANATRQAATGTLAMYLLSAEAQAMLLPYGFEPVARR
jgi:molybdenum ABC transporter molybdate-binding protein